MHKFEKFGEESKVSKSWNFYLLKTNVLRKERKFYCAKTYILQDTGT